MALIDPMIAKLEAIEKLSEADKALMLSLPIRMVSVGSHEVILSQGQRSKHSLFIITGVVARSFTLPDGARQIVSIHLKGDMPDLHSLFLESMDHSLIAMTEAVVGFVLHEEVRRVVHASGTLAARLWRETLIDAAIGRQWTANNSQRSGLARMAHLICELMLRAKVVGLLKPDGAWPFPFNQQELGEALGLSLVHTNRTLKALREDGLASLLRGQLRVMDWQRLTAIAGFNPDYLHLDEKAPASI